MDKTKAKRQVAKVMAEKLKKDLPHVFMQHDGDGKEVAPADSNRLRDAYRSLITFLEDRSKGSATARW